MSEVQNKQVVKLNVGGEIFITSVQTLLKEKTLLSAILSENLPLLNDNNDCIFIDRDGTHFRSILNFLRDGNISKPNTEKEIDEIEKEAEFYSIKGLIERCKRFKQHDSFSEDFVQVIECAYWGRVMRQEDRLDSMAKEMNVDEKFHNSEGTPVLKVPLMQDGTLSLSFLRKMFPSANGLCLDVGFKPGEIYEALKIVGNSIHPPKSGWNDYTYFTLPIKVDEKFMNTIL